MTYDVHLDWYSEEEFDQIEAWLRENFSQGVIQEPFGRRGEPHDYKFFHPDTGQLHFRRWEATSLVYWFSNPENALLFRLTWGDTQ